MPETLTERVEELVRQAFEKGVLAERDGGADGTDYTIVDEITGDVMDAIIGWLDGYACYERLRQLELITHTHLDRGVRHFGATIQVPEADPEH